MARLAIFSVLLAAMLVSCADGQSTQARAAEGMDARGQAGAPLEDQTPAKASDSGPNISNDAMGYEEAEMRAKYPEGISEAFYLCIRNAEGNKVAMGTCLIGEIDRQDARLNATYQKMLSKADAKQKHSLVEAQRAWLQFHDKTEALEQVVYGDEVVSSLQVTEGRMVRLCERTNVLANYLLILEESNL